MAKKLLNSEDDRKAAVAAMAAVFAHAVVSSDNSAAMNFATTFILDRAFDLAEKFVKRIEEMDRGA